MKKITMYLFLLAALAILSACGSDSGESCAVVSGVTCSSGGAVTACCTDSSCRYDYNGNSYPCDGTNCQGAAQDVVNACLSSVRTSPDTTRLEEFMLREKTENLLLEKEIDRLSSD